MSRQYTLPTAYDQLNFTKTRVANIERQLRDFSTAANGLDGKGGRPPASVVVAAWDAPDIDKSAADFVCEGKNDQDVINAAISYLSSKGPGTVLLTAGTFYVQGGTPGGPGAVTVNEADITLRGNGWGTILSVSGGGAAISCDGNRTQVRDLQLDLTTGGAAGNCDFDIDADYVTLSNLYIKGTNVSNSIRVSDGVYVSILDCLIDGGSSAIFVNGGDFTHISRCTILNADGDAINVGVDNAVIDNCVISGAANRGIVLGANDGRATDNYIEASGNASNEAIDISGDRNVVMGNQVNSNAAGTTQYGINITGTSNYVVLNRLYDTGAGWGTGAFNDGGTSSDIAVAGGGAAPGDNVSI